MDVLSVREALRYSIDYCTTGGPSGTGRGPLVLEVATYRYSGHSMSDPGTSYRTRDEIQEVRQTRDPIMMFKERALEAGLVMADELKVCVCVMIINDHNNKWFIYKAVMN